MATETNMNHHGITLETSKPLPAMGGVAGQYGSMVGTAPNKKADVNYNEPLTLYSPDDLVKLGDTGTLPANARFFLEETGLALDVVIVEHSDTPLTLLANIIGGVDLSDGSRTGIAAVDYCNEAPTQIAVPAFTDIGVVNALASLCDNSYAEGWVDAPDTTTPAALTYADKLGDAHQRVWCVDVHGERWSQVISPSVYGMTSRCKVKPWETPDGQPLKLDDLGRVVSYRVTNPTCEAVQLNKKGISVAVKDPNGGLMLLATRTASGDFGNIVGIENQLCREIIKSHRDTMGKNLDPDFFKLRISQLNNWGKTLKSDSAVIDFEVMLSPTRNTEARYENGEWVLTINWGAFRPNEHSIIELNQTGEIIANYVSSIL